MTLLYIRLGFVISHSRKYFAWNEWTGILNSTRSHAFTLEVSPSSLHRFPLPFISLLLKRSIPPSCDTPSFTACNIVSYWTKESRVFFSPGSVGLPTAVHVLSFYTSNIYVRYLTAFECNSWTHATSLHSLIHWVCIAITKNKIKRMYLISWKLLRILESTEDLFLTRRTLSDSCPEIYYCANPARYEGRADTCSRM